jgi:hypothetical protein
MQNCRFVDRKTCGAEEDGRSQDVLRSTPAPVDARSKGPAPGRSTTSRRGDDGGEVRRRRLAKPEVTMFYLISMGLSLVDIFWWLWR